MNNPVVKIDTYKEAANTDPSSDNSYAGMRIHALPGLHQYVADNAKQYIPLGAAILDIGAGSGAMSARLMDLGYEVSSVDIVPENFRLANKVPFYKADLNSDFSHSINKNFAGLFAVEIIEHLENPRHFLRQCNQLLQPGGHLILSTPNIGSPGSQAFFLRSGYFQWFSEADYVKQGHLTPLSLIELTRMADECKFDIEWKSSFGDSMSYFKRWPKMHLLAKLCNLVSTTPVELRGELLVMVFKKK